jgi:hypothetical protein
MPAALEKRLRAFLKTVHRENRNRYLFVDQNGNPYSVGKVTEYGLWPLQDKLGIRHTGTHAFRHAAASELLEEGAPLNVVQRQLRHGDAVHGQNAEQGPPWRSPIRATVLPDQTLSAQNLTTSYCSFAYSAWACFKMGMSGSASFQRARKAL